MFSGPVYAIIDMNFIDLFRKAISNRNRQPLPVLSGFYAISVLPFIFFVLHIIQYTKHIRPSHLVEVPKPW
jgi:hypothetical protein